MKEKTKFKRFLARTLIASVAMVLLCLLGGEEAPGANLTISQIIAIKMGALACLFGLVAISAYLYNLGILKDN